MCLSNQEDKDSIEYCEENWTQLAKDPNSWLRKAEALKNAADAVRVTFADFFQRPVYMLLAGLAVETLIKAIIVAKNPKFVEEDQLSSGLTTHNLKKLYQTASLLENNSRNDLLLRLQNYVENFGRYPVTRRKQDMKRVLQTRIADQTDPDGVDRLWSFLVNKIRPYIETDE